MNLHVNDRVGYQGVDYRVEDVLTYAMTEGSLRLFRLEAAGAFRFLELPTSDADDRVLVLEEITGLDITAPPPVAIYQRGESFLLKLSGAAKVTGAGDDTKTCTLWRYRAAGGKVLQIEQWPDGVRMFAGASVHADMLEVRPAKDT